MTRMMKTLAAAVATTMLATTAMVQVVSSATATAVTSITTTEDSSIRPFPKVHFSQKALNDLRKRILATQWPEKETVSDSSQGVPLATMRELARYWATDYDWRKAEAKLNALPQLSPLLTGKKFTSFTSVRKIPMRCR